ncbi:histidine phosphatase family protein [Sphingomonas quercus]|uniref:Histidine phosphatase family protein n=1 Tax=Sphingomonas quercus TaxID=2842451 RepID=A0ABS6BK67_9SPHN|nr:histidine phosphatase family protein [Sphingomonas quercus]MBU3078688.1 histidine phosphatase family protein [Sphingomonas quercus]
MIHLMRHGPTARPGRMLGRTDWPATPEGISDCVAQAAGLAFDHILTSDLVRAKACADAIGRAQGIAVRVDPRWRELDFGAWEGLGAAEVDAGALARFWADPDACPPPGGERWSSLTARIAAALADRPGGPLLIVTHGGAMRAALMHLTGFGLEQARAFDLPCGAVISLRLWPGSPAQIIALRPCAG